MNSRHIAIGDVTLVLAVSLLYLGFELLRIPKRWSFLLAGLALGGYVAYLVFRRAHSWRDLGFRRDNLTAGLLPVGVCTFLVGAALVGFAAVQGRTIWQPAVLVLLVLYPLWAIAQQFAATLQVLITAAAFAIVHVGNPALFVLTFLAGIMWSLLYRRWPNLWLLAGSHSVLAALA